MSCRLARLTHRPVSRLVPPFCLAARSAMWRLVPRLALSSCSSSRSYRSASRSSVSSCRLVLYRAALVVSLLSSREAGRFCVVPSLSYCYIAPARASSSSCIVPPCRLVRLVLRCVETGRAFPMSSGVLCRLVSSLVFARRLCSSSLLVVFARRLCSSSSRLRSSSWAWACGEIELTKTARFPACRLRVSSRCVRAAW